LLKCGNAVMLGLVSRNSDDYGTCSLLPLSEKQIQLEYEVYYKQLKHTSESSNQYSKIFNITMLDPLIAYSPTMMSLPTKDLAFYFNQCTGTLSDIITNKCVLSYACKNVGLFANKKELEGNLFLRKFLTEKGQVEELSSSTLKVIFNQEQDAKTYQKFIMYKGYGQTNSSDKPKQIHKISLPAINDNNKYSKVINSSAYSIKMTNTEFAEIFPNYISNQNQVALLQEEPVEKIFQLEQVLSIQK